jgi:hypothetical protein
LLLLDVVEIEIQIKAKLRFAACPAFVRVANLMLQGHNRGIASMGIDPTWLSSVVLADVFTGCPKP